MGKILQGRGKDAWLELLVCFGQLIPHYPGTSIIQPAKIPPPPKLTGKDEDADALLCLCAYEACAESFFPRPWGGAWRPPTLASLGRLRPSSRKALGKAVAALYSSATQPHLWAAWSMRDWAVYGPSRWKKNRPTMGWVFAAKRLEEKASIFVWRTSGVESGSRLVFSKTHTELINKWESMRAALLVEHQRSPLTAERVKEIVSARLSERMYAKMIRQIEKETNDRQAEIDFAFASGEFLWG